MNSSKQIRKARRRTNVVWLALIVALAAAAGMFAAWRLPGLELYAQDRLMRERGTADEPSDIVIVAIDEPSIAKLGQFPWSRDLTAKVLNNISSAEPKAVALDVLYSELTDEADDKSLSGAIKKAGNVVVAEQLIENRDTPELSRAEWLKSLTEIENSAAGTGHVNVETEADGAARELLLKLADDEGEAHWALAVETIRVGDRLNTDEISETQQFVRVGTRKIPFLSTEHNLFFKPANKSNLMINQPLRMKIDFVGPTGSYSAQTYSFSDILEGKISPEKFRNKYVLIGATAATLGDRIAAPFVHAENADGDQHGDLMPGVEILANEINTILRGRFYQPVSDLTAAFFAALAAFAVIFSLGFAQGKFELVKQIGILVGLLALIVFGSYSVFAHWLIVPPLVPMLASFIVAAPLALMQRSLAASAFLDEQIAELSAAEKRLLINGRGRISSNSIRFDSENGERIKREEDFSGYKFYLPRGLEQKSDTLGFLTRDLVNRADFVDSALRSIEDGLLIADRDGQIIFANQSAAEIFNLPERRLIGSSILTLIFEAENKNADSFEDAEELLAQLTIDRKSIEREVTFGADQSRFYVLRMSAVVGHDENDAGENESLGIIATLSDITHHRELQKTKNDVIALVTHELRTPLTAIQGMSEVLTEHDVAPEPRRKMLLTINTEAKRLAQMINEYLDITRLEAGAQKINFAPVEIENLIERTLLLLEPLAAKRRISITENYLTNKTVISADAQRLAQMLTNIVGNAIKYSSPETSITVETKKIESVLKIIVSDEGCGISAEQMPRIFEKFYRAPRRDEAEIAGTGLGLALAREIAEQHGGRISAESTPHQGSTFTVYLPIDK